MSRLHLRYIITGELTQETDQIIRYISNPSAHTAPDPIPHKYSAGGTELPHMDTSPIHIEQTAACHINNHTVSPTHPTKTTKLGQYHPQNNTLEKAEKDNSPQTPPAAHMANPLSNKTPIPLNPIPTILITHQTLTRRRPGSFPQNGIHTN